MKHKKRIINIAFVILGLGELHAQEIPTVTNNGSSNSFYLGQDTLGGIVYYINKDTKGIQHGLIVNKNESKKVWQSYETTTHATRKWDGAYNTELMILSPSATYVKGLKDDGFTDWYLPAIDELELLYQQKDIINKTLNTGGFTLLSKTRYWSSTEYHKSGAYNFLFYYGEAGLNAKDQSLNIRAVRAF